jgi:hypothetical protein
LGRVGTFGVVACVQEAVAKPGDLLAAADPIHYTMGASEKDEERSMRLLLRESGSEELKPFARANQLRRGIFGPLLGQFGIKAEAIG